MYQSIELRKACCAHPQDRAAGADAGRQACLDHRPAPRAVERPRRRAASTRATTTAGRIKFNPLADWTWGDVWHYISVNKVAYNPLHDEFYPEHRLRALHPRHRLGEDFRAGRWWWEDEAAKECGLHVKNAIETQGTAPRA